MKNNSSLKQKSALNSKLNNTGNKKSVSINERG